MFILTAATTANKRHYGLCGATKYQIYSKGMREAQICLHFSFICMYSVRCFPVRELSQQLCYSVMLHLYFRFRQVR